MNIKFLLATIFFVAYLLISAGLRADELTKTAIANSIEKKKSPKISMRHQIESESEFEGTKLESKKRENVNSIVSKVGISHKTAHKIKKVNLGKLVKPWSVNFKSENIPTNINKKIMAVELMYEMRF